ncbi:hypothetical protein [Paracoccus siganidrum]|uniref:Uncharacterized protein n=1 Tax=Paracoccus siganidrum TaxID=1276757 RepID=A0A419A6P6_9RHOB|nr:hypothetical protein [Paracoccus siganidrum]RJL15293.1 hypothetical protein D3P05_10805 [Paracoccus siganidrum]RMC39354.1 hypothetical protein C9E82_05085 [Paracoccus siganidrum]
MNDMSTAGLGHNSPPPYDPEITAKLEDRVRELADAGAAWLELKRITDEEQAGKLNDFTGQCRAAFKEIEDARKAAKEPHLEAGRAVDAKFKTLTSPLEDLGKALKKMLADYAAEKQRKLDEQKRLEREEAARKAAEAERLRKEAEASNDVIAKAEAEAAAKEAERAQKQADKEARAQIASGTGGGRTMSTRTTYRARIEDDSAARRAFSFLLSDADGRAALIAEMERLCTAARRRKDGPSAINGVKWIEERTVS